MRFQLSFVLIIAVLLTNCSTNQYIKSASGKWQMVWNDEFDYTGFPDAEKWSYDTDGNAFGWGNNEAQYYTEKNKENVWVENGEMTITALKKPMELREYTSARVITKYKGDWKYGRIEVRAKIPTGRGTWPAIWMLPTDWEYGDWPDSGEIDIMENVGFDPDTIVASAHTKTYNHVLGTQKNAKIGCADCYHNYHIYTLEWERNEYRVYLDDTLYFTYKNDQTGYAAWPYDKRFHLLINLAIGGNWGGMQGIDDSLFPHYFKIDYVRVYKKV